MNKIEDNWKAFGLTWFQKNQKALLWLLNTPVIRDIIRKVMCIDNKEKIISIKPHCYTVQGEQENEYITDFRTHWKYSKRVYFALKPIWWILHYLDMAFLDKYTPELSFGFDTLTAYPDAGAGNTTVDGHVGRTSVDETFASIRGGDGNSKSDTLTSLFIRLRCSATNNQFSIMERAILTFNTSALTSDASISAAVFSIEGLALVTTLGTTTLDVVSSAPANDNAVITGDYSSLGSTSFGNVSSATYSIVAYNDISLNASGIANISKIGISKFGLRQGWDLAGSFGGSWSANAYQTFSARSADTTDTTSDPKLVVTYTIAAPPAGDFVPQIIVVS